MALMAIQKCKADNISIAEERLAAERRRQAVEDARANKQKTVEGAGEPEDTSMLDNLLEKLRSGEGVGRKARRTRPTAPKPAAPLNLSADVLLGSAGGNDAADLARDMLARLQSDGFQAVPASPTTSTTVRRSTRRRLQGIAKELEDATAEEASLQDTASVAGSIDFSEDATAVDSVLGSEGDTVVADDSR